MSRMVFMAALVAYVLIFWDSDRLQGARLLLSAPAPVASLQLAGAPAVAAFPAGEAIH